MSARAHLSGIRRRDLFARRTFVAAGLVVVLSGCGGGTHPAAMTTTQTTTSAAATTSTTTSTSNQGPPATIAATTTTPVSVGFQSVSFTAVGENNFWVLGSEPCAAGNCMAIVSTSDGGKSFVSVPAPAVGTIAGRTPMLRFADTQDGWLFIPDDNSSFYVTHDGGKTWTRLRLGALVAFATGGGHAYAVTADCTADRCSGFRFLRTVVSRDAWTSSALPFTPDGPMLDLSAHGGNVWLLGTRKSQSASRFDVLAHSTDAGQSFSVGEGPCTPDLGGELAPSSASVVWAVCPTGTLAWAARSTDGGLTFAPLHTPPDLPNSALLAPASDRAALLLRDTAPPLLTTDGGSSWATPKTSARPSGWLWAGFTDAEVGAAIVQPQTSSSAGARTQLWRTTDGGARWAAVSFH